MFQFVLYFLGKEIDIEFNCELSYETGKHALIFITP